MAEYCSFSASGQTTTLSRAAELGNGESWGRTQARGRTQDGQFHAVDKGFSTRMFSLQFRALTDADKTNLEDFVDNYAIGSTVDVIYTDHDLVQWRVRFLSPTLDWAEQWDPGSGFHDVSFDLEVIARISAS